MWPVGGSVCRSVACPLSSFVGRGQVLTRPYGLRAVADGGGFILYW